MPGRCLASVSHWPSSVCASSLKVSDDGPVSCAAAGARELAEGSDRAYA